MITISWKDQTTTPGTAGGDVVSSTVSSLPLDIITSQQRDVTVVLPTHPVEDGAAVTDHVTTQPGTVSVEALVGDAVVSEIVVASTRRTVELYPGTKASGVLGVDSDKSRTVDVLEQLTTLTERGTVVDVAGTIHGDIEGYQILSLSSPHDMTMGRQTLTVTITFQKRDIATTSEVEAPAPLVERARPTTESGNTPATPETDDASDASQRASDLYSILPTALRGAAPETG